MRISRLFIPNQLKTGQQIELQDENAHYVRNVLRLKKSQAITLFNGQGGEFLCTLNEVSRKKVLLEINQHIRCSTESCLNITLGLAISRGDRMDWAVQKSVELGVNTLTPLITERCVIKFKGNKKQLKIQHWKNIVQHATEQCNRTILPLVNEIESMQNWLRLQHGLKLFLDPGAEKSLAELSPINNHITLLSGPEGGFSQHEKESAIMAGFIPVRLGNRILRTETAVLAAISATQILWGDFAIWSPKRC